MRLIPRLKKTMSEVVEYAVNDDFPDTEELFSDIYKD